MYRYFFFHLNLLPLCSLPWQGDKNIRYKITKFEVRRNHLVSKEYFNKCKIGTRVYCIFHFFNFILNIQGDLKQKQKEKDLADEENFGNSSWGLFRAWLWNILEYPWTSRLAQVSYIVSNPSKITCVKPVKNCNFNFNSNESNRGK